MILIEERGGTMTTPNKKMLALSGTILAWVFLILTGLFQFFQGLNALTKREFYAKVDGDLLGFDLTAWGWIHIVIGAGLVTIGVCLMLDYDWARGVGIGLAMLSALDQFLFLPHYPVWSIIIILLNVMVIWSLSTRRDLYDA